MNFSLNPQCEVRVMIVESESEFQPFADVTQVKSRQTLHFNCMSHTVHVNWPFILQVLNSNPTPLVQAFSTTF